MTYDLWPLWIYLGGFIVTFMGLFGKGAYDDYDISSIEYVFPTFGAALVWPLTWLYFGGKDGGLYFKSRKEKALKKQRAQELLADKHAKLLKEAGL